MRPPNSFRFKVFVLGESGSGKTSLIQNISKNWSNVDRHETIPGFSFGPGLEKDQNGLNLTHKTLEVELNPATDPIDKRVKIRTTRRLTLKPGMPESVSNTMITFWDFPKGSRQDLIHQFFLDPNGIYILTFNLSQYSEPKLYTWLQTIKLRAKGVSVVLLVGTHADMLTEEEIEEKLTGLVGRLATYSGIHNKLKVYSVSNTTDRGMDGVRLVR